MLKTAAGLAGIAASGVGVLAWQASSTVVALPLPPAGSFLRDASSDPRFKQFLPNNAYKDAFVITVKRKPLSGIDDFARNFFSSLAFLPERTLLPWITPKDMNSVKIADPGQFSIGDVPLPAFEVVNVARGSQRSASTDISPRTFPTNGSASQLLLQWSAGTFETAKIGGFTWLAMVERDTETDLWFGSSISGASPVDQIPGWITWGHAMYARILLYSAARKYSG